MHLRLPVSSKSPLRDALTTIRCGGRVARRCDRMKPDPFFDGQEGGLSFYLNVGPDDKSPG